MRAPLLFSFAVISQLAATHARASDFIGTVSQALHQTLTGQRCADATESELVLVRCPKSNDWFHSLDQTVETGFFSRGAAVQLDHDRCGLSRTQHMISAPAQMMNTIAGDVNAKLPRIRALFAQIQNEKKDLDALRPLIQREPGGGMIPQANVDLYFRRSKEINETLEQIAPLYSALVKSTSLGNFDQGQKLLRKLMSGQSAVTEDQVRDAYVRENIDLSHDIAKLEKSRTSPTQFNIGRGEREELFKHGQPETWLDATAPAARGLMCRMDARYGQGVNDLAATVAIGGCVFGLAAGPLVELGVGAEIGVRAAMTGRAAMLADTAQMMAAGSRLFGGLATLQQVQSSCPMIHANARCDADPNSEISALSERNCALMVALAVGAPAAQFAMSPLVRAQFAKVMMLAKSETRAAAAATKSRTLASLNVSMAQVQAEAPDMADTINDAREIALAKKFRAVSKQDEEVADGAIRKVKDPEFRKTLIAVRRKLMDQKKWAAYFERLLIDAGEEMKATGNPKWIKAYHDGELQRAAVMKVLAKRARARGEVIQSSVRSIVDDEKFFGAVAKGPFVDVAHTSESTHGMDSHFIQMDFVADTIEHEIPGRSREFYHFLGTDITGREAWSWTYDTFEGNPTSPDYLHKDFMPKQIPRL